MDKRIEETENMLVTKISKVTVEMNSRCSMERVVIKGRGHERACVEVVRKGISGKLEEVGTGA